MQRRGLSRATGLNRQALAAFRTARIQHGATGASCHASTKAMSALAANDRRLECTFHSGLAKL